MDESVPNIKVFIQKVKEKQNFSNSPHKDKLLVVDNPIFSNSIRDCSHSHIAPKVLFRPLNCSQLVDIIHCAKKFEIPLTFANGKTGLSGAYSNPYAIVDLERLESLKDPIQFDFNVPDNQFPTVLVEQKTLVSDLIRLTEIQSRGKNIFPIHPSSAYKLPVRVGGILSTNASGLMSGGLGATESWVVELEVMTPDGTRSITTPGDALFDKVIGGMGYYGVILSAKFCLPFTLQNPSYKVIFGYSLDELGKGLQEVQDQSVFPMVSEFVYCVDGLYGKFNQYTDFIAQKYGKPIRWAVLLKGKPKILEKFQKILSPSTTCCPRQLKESEFQELIEERSVIAIQSLPGENDKEYVRYPGFEDTLVQPECTREVVDQMNEILISHKYPKIIVVYGHVNFQKGKGVLIHTRLPISLDDLCEKPLEVREHISQTVAELMVTLFRKYSIVPKAEHGLGFLYPWIYSSKTGFVSSWKAQMRRGEAFYNPHLEIFERIVESKRKDGKNPMDADIQIEIVADLFRVNFALKKI